MNEQVEPTDLVVRATLKQKGKSQYIGRCALHFRKGPEGDASHENLFDVITETQDAATALLESYLSRPQGTGFVFIKVVLAPFEMPDKKGSDRYWRGTVEDLKTSEVKFECESPTEAVALDLVLAYMKKISHNHEIEALLRTMQAVRQAAQVQRQPVPPAFGGGR